MSGASPTNSIEVKPGKQDLTSAARTTADRRRRKRAKISAQVRVRAINSPTAFEEVCKTVDVSRDGLLFLSSHSGYWKRQPLEVTFPYSTEPSALNQAQNAEVARVFEQSVGLFGVAVQFASARNASRKGISSGTANAPAYAPLVSDRSATIVLAVEPDEQLAAEMRRILEQEGYTVVIVEDGQASLDVLKTTVPAVFLTEAENDDISGHDLCMIIKKNERLQHVPVILLSQSTQPADYSSSQQLGAVVCVTKPFNPGRLLHIVRLVAPPPTQQSAYGAPVQSNAIERSF